MNPTTGVILYTPATGYSGADSIQYTVGDSLLSVSPPGTITLSVIASAPVAAAITAPPIVNSGSDTIDVVAAAVDMGGTINPASVTITTAPANGVALVNASTGAITYTPNSGFTGLDTLQYTLSDNGHTVSAPATISLNVGLTINNTTARSVTFVDAGGSRVRISLTGGGTDTLFFNGNGIAQNIPGPHGSGNVILRGTGLSISSMQITGSTITSALTITRAGITPVSISNITVTGALGRLIAPTSVLTGALSVSGSMSLLQLGTVSGASINIGSAGATRAGLTFSAGHVVSASLVSATPLRSLHVIDWTEAAGTDSITAPSITSLTTTGNFQASVTANAGAPFAIQVARIGGQISADTWNLTGKVSSITAGSIASGWVGNLSGSLGLFSVRAGGFDGTLVAAGTAGNISIVGDDTGNITAASIRSIRGVGQLNGASITTTNGVVPR